MRVTNPAPPSALHADLARALEQMRTARGFDASNIARDKAALLNAYMAQHHLRACVVAVSGGVDSAVVLALAARAATDPQSPIEKLVAVAAPVHDPQGATGQRAALDRAREVARACGVELAVVDLTAAHQAIKSAVDTAVGIDGADWASGQLVAYTRTPAFYYTTSLLTQEGQSAVLLGTTNRDEGAYLGYVGKAADGMVDIQLIADLHKSEVWALGEALDVPREVIEVVPTGDMFDGRPDTDVFGTPYDFVEFYLGWRCLETVEQTLTLARLSPAARSEFDELASRLEHLHDYNAHKYLVGSPAVHLNLLPAAVPGGWRA